MYGKEAITDVACEVGLHPRSARRSVRRSVRQGDIGDKPRVSRSDLASRDNSLAHLVVARERGLDLAELDPKPSNLHLMIHATEMLESAIGKPADKISCLVHAVARAERIGNEPLVGQPGAVDVSTRDTTSADEELAGNPDRNRLAAGVQDIDAGVGDRPTDRDRSVIVDHLVDRRPDRRLGRPVHVPQRSGRLSKGAGKIGRESLCHLQNALQPPNFHTSPMHEQHPYTSPSVAWKHSRSLQHRAAGSRDARRRTPCARSRAPADHP